MSNTERGSTAPTDRNTTSRVVCCRGDRLRSIPGSAKSACGSLEGYGDRRREQAADHQSSAGSVHLTEQHYSFVRINGTGPLPDYPSNDKATDVDKVAVFNALYLNSGTYTVTANMLTTRAMVAKSAFVIGASNQYEFAVNGKALVLTQKPSGAVIKLVRVE
jgi:hypothetical protein